ncbi:HAMP domain-containing histidine kinase [bacterium]|nr:HAMP domain-containing histidine kinase [bacterium]
MVKDLLQSTRPINPSTREVDLSTWCQSFQSAFQTANPDVSLKIDLPEQRLINTDPDLLQRVLWNLSLNAVQAGEKLITILMNSTQPDLSIKVIDGGPGIPEDILGNLFVPGNTNRPEGSGMGLYNCHRVTSALGGTLEVKSGNAGTTFHIKVPLKGGENNK